MSNLLTLNPTQQQFDLSEARQSEIGLKQMFWNGQGEWTLAAYHIVKKKLLSRETPTSPTVQIGQQSSDGLEATLELALGRGWQVSANAAFVRAEYDDFIEGGGDRSGNRPTNVPKRTANLWLNKALGGGVDAGIGARYVDARYADTANTAKVPGYTVVDANIAWQALPDVRLGLELNNLFDRQYATSASSDGEQWYLGRHVRSSSPRITASDDSTFAYPGAGLVARRPASAARGHRPGSRRRRAAGADRPQWLRQDQPAALRLSLPAAQRRPGQAGRRGAVAAPAALERAARGRGAAGISAGLRPARAQVAAMGRTPHKGLFDGDDAEDRRLVDEALARVGLSGLAQQPFACLSGGEKQRALLARALVQQPQVLILDEPTNHLDPRYQLELLGQIKALGLATLASFHDLNLAAAFCDRLCVLDQGRLVAIGTPAEVLTAELLQQVFGLQALVDTHPLAGHPRITWIV